MVSIQRNTEHLVLNCAIRPWNFFSSGKSCPWITNICAENFISNNQNWDTGGPREPEINIWIFKKRICNLQERLVKLFLDLSWVYNSLIYFSLIKSKLYTRLNLFRKRILYIFRDQLSIHSMAIGHGKKMSSPIFPQMRKYQEAILVCFVWILRWIPCLGSECKLSDTIIKLFISLPRLDLMLRSWHLFRDRSPDVIQYVWLALVILFRSRIACNFCIWVSLRILSWNIFLFVVIPAIGRDIWMLGILFVDGPYVFTRCWRLSAATVSLLGI